MLATAATPSCITIAAYTVTTTPGAIAASTVINGVAQQAIRLCAPSTNTASIFYGGTGMTTSTGCELAPGQTQDVYGVNPSLIWAAVASGTQNLRILVM
jgi:hypothetical protein